MDPSTLEHNHRIWLAQDITKVMIGLIKDARSSVVEFAIKQNPLSEIGQTQAVLYLNSAKTLDECILILEKCIVKQPLN